MITDIHIENFKSVVNLDIQPGRFNVLIGENGCGKSNILEAITFASSASVNQLEVQDLERRGMRVPAPDFMYSAFEHNSDKDIKMSFSFSDEPTEFFNIHFDASDNQGHWSERGNENAEKLIARIKDKSIETTADLLDIIRSEFSGDEYINISINTSDNKLDLRPFSPNKSISNFRIYSPDERSLRRFDNPDSNVLQVNGTGLFSYLKKMSATETGAKMLNEIRENMSILDWFDDMDIPQNSLSGDNTLRFADQYIDENLRYFDQRSVNEAFLYLLFFFTLFISDTTPQFFAIDNIESALNPKMCRKFTGRLIDLATKYNKQVIVTTHNPFVLDALNLQDDSQRLFVISRDIDGHTHANRIKTNQKLGIPLSEAWMRGYIGGLPNNF